VSYISHALRNSVNERAKSCCEYCRIERGLAVLPFEIDHIIAVKHGGATNADNLCLACFDCNHAKGTDIASVDWTTGRVEVLFNPRAQRWSDHFEVRYINIEPLSPTGRATVFLLKLNESVRLVERELMFRLNRYPCKP
jgi:hypothetical protein